MEALAKRFGEVHVEQRYDDYAVLRIVFNDACRLKGIDDSFTDQNPVFSSVVEFVDQNDTIKTNALTCHFLSARHTLSLCRVGRQQSKIYQFSEQSGTVERANPDNMATAHTMH